MPRRWTIKRIFGWMGRWRRRLSDYEQRRDVSKAMILIATGSILLRSR